MTSVSKEYVQIHNKTLTAKKKKKNMSRQFSWSDSSQNEKIY